MKKLKSKMIAILMILMLWMSCFSSAVQAHDIEKLDPQNWITLPMLITSSTAHVTISSSAGDYQFYYQLVFLTDTQFNNIKAKMEQGKANIEAEKAKLEELEAKVETALEKYQEESEKDPSSEATNTAKEEYQELYNQYRDEIDTYNEKVNAENREINASIPGFVESSWKQANDGTIEIEYGDRTGQIHFVIWGKLVNEEGTYYDCNVYSTTLQDRPAVSISKTSLSMKVGTTYTLEANPENSTQKIVWSSSNEEVATVDQNGKVQALKEGKAIIYAKLEDGSAEASCEVSVSKSNANTNTNTENTETNETKPQGNIVIPNNQTQNEQQGNLTINGSNKPTNISGNMDNTKATGTIPQAGTNYFALFSVIGFSIIGLIAYCRYRKYNF